MQNCADLRYLPSWLTGDGKNRTAGAAHENRDVRIVLSDRVSRLVSERESRGVLSATGLSCTRLSSGPGLPPPVYHAPRVQRGPVYRQPQARGPVYRSPQGHGPVHRPPVVTHRFNPARHHGPHYGLHGHFLNGVWYADPNDPPYDGQAGDIDEGGGGLSTLAWSVTNNSGQNLRLEFRSENRDNVWPGNGQVYTLPSGGGINASLSCQAGEHICWGAWNSDNSRYWGTGRGGNAQTAATIVTGPPPIQI